MSTEYKLKNITKEELMRLCEEDPDSVANEIYKIAGEFLKTKKLHNLEIKDLIQDLVLKAWVIIDKFDDTRASFSTFLFFVFNNELKQKYRKQTAKRRITQVISLNAPIPGNETIHLIDTLPDTSNSPISIKILKEVAKPITIEYFEGTTQSELAKKYNISQTHVSRLIKKDIKKIKEQLY